MTYSNLKWQKNTVKFVWCTFSLHNTRLCWQQVKCDMFSFVRQCGNKTVHITCSLLSKNSSINRLSWSKTNHCDNFCTWLFKMSACGYLKKDMQRTDASGNQGEKPRGIIRICSVNLLHKGALAIWNHSSSRITQCRHETFGDEERSSTQTSRQKAYYDVLFIGTIGWRNAVWFWEIMSVF